MEDSTARNTPGAASPERFIRDGVSANDLAGRLLGDVQIKGARLDAAVERYRAAIQAHLMELAVGDGTEGDVAAYRRRLADDVQQAHHAVEEALRDLERTYATVRRAFGES